MADDVLLDFLHHEIVNVFAENSEKNPNECISKLEHLGFTTGYRIAERLTKDLPRFKNELETMKFVCKEFWVALYKRQIDNLRTNHHGVYVLQDNKFRFLTQFSSGQQYLESAPKYLAFSCGVVRGGLANLAINGVVTASVTSMPSCKFQIQIQTN